MIAQADSRKWMACLYNSFLFMEAKIMKMAKKLLAVVLTGVMALSMLTGCALSDRAIGKALADALNDKQVQDTQTIKYSYDNDLNGAAEKLYKSEVKDKETSAAVADLTYKKVGTKDYLYVIVARPDNYKKFGGWITAADDLNTKVAANGPAETVAHGTTLSTDTAKVYTSNASAAKKPVSFGIYEGKSKETTTTNYVVIVFKAAPVAAQ